MENGKEHCRKTAKNKLQLNLETEIIYEIVITECSASDVIALLFCFLLHALSKAT